MGGVPHRRRRIRGPMQCVSDDITATCKGSTEKPVCAMAPDSGVQTGSRIEKLDTRETFHVHFIQIPTDKSGIYYGGCQSVFPDLYVVVCSHVEASRLLKHGRIAMTEVAAFPAFARAKKLFLQRKHATRQREGGDHTDSTSIRLHEGSSSSGPERVQQRRQESGCAAESEVARRCTASLVAFCSDFDEQLRLVNSDLLLLNTSVRREYQRESLALEKLTSELLDGEVNEVKAPPTNHRVVKRCRARLRARKPRIKLHVVLQSPQRTSTPKHPPSSPKILSRAALLAQQAVKACVLQSYTRLYLYRYLYRGGASQLVAAVKLASHCRLSRTFRHWRRVVTQRIKLRLRCHRAQQRIQRTATSIARSRAFEIVQMEGKYAMAKEFQQTKLLAQSFHSLLGWYLTSTGPSP